MPKEVALCIDRARDLGVASLHAAGPLARFGLGTAPGCGDMISNLVVVAIDDVSRVVRLYP